MNKTKKTFLLLLVSIMCMSLVLIPSFPVQAAESNSVQVWLTDISSNKWVEQQNDVLFQTVQTTNPLTINVDASRKYQEVQGFGAAMTDSSAWLINKLSDAQRTELMNKLFDPSSGIGLSLIRSPMGATDVNASGSYSYDDMPAGQTDPTLSNFSIQHDVPYIIPALQQALSLNPSIKIMANTWSPPGWMKTSDSMIGGTLKDEYYTNLANYFVKFIQAYSNAGVPISYVSPQNEPMGTPTWPGMFLSAYQESRLVQEMGQAFAANNIPSKILAWDHNWDVPSYPETIFSNPTASQYADGTGWHIYSGSPIFQTQVHNDYPGKQVFITEGTGGTWQADNNVALHDALDTWIINGTRNWANGVMLWNIALDPAMGPLNSDTNGIPMMRGLVTIDPTNGGVSYNADYHALAHASKFVKPGAYRIYSNTFGEGSVENVAFQNPDGSKVLIVYNSGSDSKTFSVADGTQSFDYTLNAGNAVTFTWSGPQQSGIAPAAASVTDSTYDFRFSDSTIITSDPALLPLQNTIRTGNSLLTYSLPIGASIQTAGTLLDRSQWTVTASSNSVGDGTGNAAGDAAVNAIDGDLASRWTTGHGMKNGDWFQINLGSPTSFNQVVLDNSVNSSFDYITKYQVYVSNDGVNWGSAIANGNGGIGKITITLPTQTAQYIRIVSTAPSGFWWSIGEINVYGSSSGTDSIAAPTAVSNGLQLQNWTSPEGAQDTVVTAVYNGTGSSQSFPISSDSSFIYTLPSGTSAMITTKDSSSDPTPAFSSLTPNEGIAGFKVTINGSDFGKLQGLGTVNFGSIPAIIGSWSDSSISAYVPGGLPSGTVTVSVYGSGGIYAGGSSFDVRALPAALPKTGWTATATDVSPWGDVPGNILDGDINSRYSSGTGQYNGLSFTVDMGQPQTFNKVMLDSDGSIGDYARSADVYVSTDGTNWTKVSSIVSDGQQVQLASFQAQTARYIKVVNTGSAGTWWSISEFNVYNTRTSWTATATDVSPWGDVPGKMLDGNAETRYSSGTGQYNGLSFTVDMGQTEAFNKIVIDSGSGSNDYARSADVFVSTDGTDWTKVSSITGIGPVQEVTFETQTARYIKVVNTGTEGYWWSVAEFDAFIAPTDYRGGWTATATDVSPWGDVPGNMLDNNASTRYSSGTGQYDGLSFTVDMGQSDTFDKIVIDSGSGSNDYARSSDVFVSTDGTNWNKVTSVTGRGPVQEITLSSQTARYIKVVVTGSEDYWWSVAEFDVYDTRANWTVTATDVSPWGDVPGNMLDGNASTRYSSGTGQYDGLSFTVDMGKSETFNKIVIDSGSGSNDYARSSDVLVSTDGTNWTKVTSVTGSSPVQEVTFQAQTARYIKVVVTGNEGYWWSVAEFNVYNEEDTDYRAGWTATATDVSPWGDVPGNMLDGNALTRYSSGTGQYDGLSFTVDMGQSETFNKIVIDSGSGSTDYARSSDVYVSTDGTNWNKVTSVTGSGPAQEVTFPSQIARYIKVVCTGSEGYWWSVAEFDVYNTIGELQEVYFKHEGEEITSLKLKAQETEKTITLEAWGKPVADGEDVNITSIATWSVQSGQDVVSVDNGIVTIKKDGKAVVKIAYDGKETTLELDIKKTKEKETASDTDTGEVLGIVQNPDGSSTTIDGSRAVTEYSADIISSKIAAINQQSIKKITVTLPDTSAAINELVFAADAVKKIINEKLDLKVELENTSLSIPSSVLKEISADLKIEIKTLTDTEKQNVLTNLNGLKATGPIIEFTLKSVEGNVQNSVTKFKEKVTIEIDPESTSNTDTKKLGIYYLDETSGKWIYVGGKYDSATGKVEAKTGHFTKFAVMEYSKSFSDIGSTHWAKADIEVLAAKHITSGVRETLFDPAGKVTRAQFATFLVSALGIDLPAYKGTFTDVPEGQWYTEYVEAAQASGIINGAGNNRFAPNEEITREQMAVMVMNAYAYATAQTANTVGKDVNTGFDDLDQAASWSKDAIKASFKLGIINGVNKTSYEPGMLAQRDQAASIIYRFLEAIGEL